MADDRAGHRMIFGAIPAYLVRRRSDRVEKRSGEQDDVISLLLKDFAADRGDWIWSCDIEGKLVGISEKFAVQAGQPPAAWKASHSSLSSPRLPCRTVTSRTRSSWRCASVSPSSMSKCG